MMQPFSIQALQGTATSPSVARCENEAAEPPPPLTNDHPPLTSNSLQALTMASFNHANNFAQAINTTMTNTLDFARAEDVEAHEIEYRGQRIAAFDVDGEVMICLPQAYELFLKNLVGGLHTVYTKLKRLEITPRVCNVEQVRALRSLGAIQPGVNRCKLIRCNDFDTLYDDCINSSRSHHNALPTNGAHRVRSSKRSSPLSNAQPSGVAIPPTVHNPTALFDAMQRILISKRAELDDEKKLPIASAPFPGRPFAAPPVPQLLQLMHQQQLNGSTLNGHSAGNQSDPLNLSVHSASGASNTATASANSDGSATTNNSKRLNDVVQLMHGKPQRQPQAVDADTDERSDSGSDSASGSMAPAAPVTSLPPFAAALVAMQMTQHSGALSTQIGDIIGTLKAVDERIAKYRQELNDTLGKEYAECTVIEPQFEQERRQRKIYAKRWRHVQQTNQELKKARTNSSTTDHQSPINDTGSGAE